MRRLQVVKRTQNRMPRTDAPNCDELPSPCSADAADFAISEAPFRSLLWKRGVEVPPLLPANPAAVLLCQSILDGTAVELPSIVVSEAVAVLIFRLVVKSKSLSQCDSSAVYVILASLFHGRIVVADPDGAKRLMNVLNRKRSSSQPGGLDVALRWSVGHREQDPTLRGMSYEEAEADLLRKWDLFGLEFDFGSGQPVKVGIGVCFVFRLTSSSKTPRALAGFDAREATTLRLNHLKMARLARRAGAGSRV